MKKNGNLKFDVSKEDGRTQFASMVGALQQAKAQFIVESTPDGVEIILDNLGPPEWLFKRPRAPRSCFRHVPHESEVVDGEDQKSGRRRWTPHEWVLCRELYNIFGGPYPPNRHCKHPNIKKLAAILDRTPQSVYLRLANLGSCDPNRKKWKGFKNSAHAKKYFEMPNKSPDEFKQLLEESLKAYDVIYEFAFHADEK